MSLKGKVVINYEWLDNGFLEDFRITLGKIASQQVHRGLDMGMTSGTLEANLGDNFDIHFEGTWEVTIW